MREDSTPPRDEERSGGFAGALLSAGATLADFFFPRLCCGCGERVLAPGKLICPRCEATIDDLQLPLCPICGLPDVPGGAGDCPDCPRGTIHFAAARGTTPFTGLAKTLVEKLKYSGRVEYAPAMADRMSEALAREFSGLEFDCIVPVPLHPSRYRERGFNQSEELARHLAEKRKLELAPGLLRRVRVTSTQTRLGRRKRAENIRNAFACPRPDLVAGRRILLVDDVYTTGATLNECARMLREAGASSTHCLAYARATLAS